VIDRVSVMYCSVTMDENNMLGLRIAEMKNTDSNMCTDMLTLPANGSTSTVPDDVEPPDVKPELTDLSECKPCEVRQCDQRATKSCQTEITMCDEFWKVRIS